MLYELFEFSELDWRKANGLIPAIIQDVDTLQILMLGYMNEQSLIQTVETGKVIFYSRSRDKLWVKGETSGNFLQFVKIIPDCDKDTLLILVKPVGDCCHLDKISCFDEAVSPDVGVLKKLEKIIAQRYQARPKDSYTSKLFDEGTQRIAQKVGEEGVELALAATTGKVQEIIAETSDLIYHILVLLRQCGVDFSDILNELQQRYNK